MPQMNKGGKFIYGISVVRSDGGVQFPTQAIQEYRISAENISVYREQVHRRILRDKARIAAVLQAWAHSDRNSGAFAL